MKNPYITSQLLRSLYKNELRNKDVLVTPNHLSIDSELVGFNACLDYLSIKSHIRNFDRVKSEFNTNKFYSNKFNDSYRNGFYFILNNDAQINVFYDKVRYSQVYESTISIVKPKHFKTLKQLIALLLPIVGMGYVVDRIDCAVTLPNDYFPTHLIHKAKLVDYKRSSRAYCGEGYEMNGLVSGSYSGKGNNSLVSYDVDCYNTSTMVKKGENIKLEEYEARNETRIERREFFDKKVEIKELEDLKKLGKISVFDNMRLVDILSMQEGLSDKEKIRYRALTEEILSEGLNGTRRLVNKFNGSFKSRDEKLLVPLKCKNMTYDEILEQCWMKGMRKWLT